MQLFLDSANLTEIGEVLDRGFIKGITTNPSIISRETGGNFTDQIHHIISLMATYNSQDMSLSIELYETNPTRMAKQAENFMNTFAYHKNLYIKVPIGWNELEVIHDILSMGGKVNCTCCMSYNQAIMAANAGASYVSLFWGRIRDIGYDAATIVRQVHETFVANKCATQIIVGSIRQMIDINEAIQAGADIVTVPAKFFPMMCQHPKTDEAVAQFIKDFSAWEKP